MRQAAIDIGTNSVLLLVAERDSNGRLRAVVDRAEVTRLGRGVDRSRQLSQEGMDATVQVLAQYVAEAKSLGATRIQACATSAARDAENAEVFVAMARQVGVDVEVISGEREAQLSYASVADERGADLPLVVLDIGGGSTEFIYGEQGKVTFRQSFNVGTVRLTERLIRSDPPSSAERAAVEETLFQTFRVLPLPPQGAPVVGLAATVTTLFALTGKKEGALGLDALDVLANRLAALTSTERAALPGMHPKRADVICTGAWILQAALRAVGVRVFEVSFRGLRWGLLLDAVI